jgi:hypothetical protein
MRLRLLIGIWGRYEGSHHRSPDNRGGMGADLLLAQLRMDATFGLLEGSMKLLCLIICLLISSCSVMPYKLSSNVDRPTPIESVNLTIHAESIWMSSYHCHKLAWRINPIFMVAALGTIPACADVSYSISRRVVTDCEVWYPKGDEYLLEHELKHCMGYKDSLY